MLHLNEIIYSLARQTCSTPPNSYNLLCISFFHFTHLITVLKHIRHNGE